MMAGWPALRRRWWLWLGLGLSGGLGAALWLLAAYAEAPSPGHADADIPVALPQLSQPYKEKLGRALDNLQDVMNSKGISAYQTVNQILGRIEEARQQPDSSRKLASSLDPVRLFARDIQDSIYRDVSFPDPVIRELITTQAIQPKGRDTIIHFRHYCDQLRDGLLTLHAAEGQPEARQKLFDGIFDLLSERVARLREFSGKMEALIGNTNSRVSRIRQAL
jgi:hypothetical protein